VGPLPRCYRLTVGPWTIPQRAEYPEQRVVPPTPHTLLLDSARTEWLLGMPPDQSLWRRLRGQSGDTAWTAFERTLSFRAWRVKRDSLFATFSTGFSGLSMRFRIAGDSLLGEAEALSDISGVEFPTAPASGMRVTCPR
jgi:hypothetical protein